MLDERKNEMEIHQLEERIDEESHQLEQEEYQLNGSESSDCSFYPSIVKHAEQ